MTDPAAPPRAIVITGASSGIGRATALRLDRLGYRVFAGVRHPADGLALQERASARLTPIRLDVTDAASIAAAVTVIAKAVDEAGLAGLVNNAAIAESAPVEVVPLADLRRHFEVNVVGPMAVKQAFLPLLRQGRGRIVNVGSISGRIVLPALGAYTASKFALEALTAALRMELSPWGIPVTIIEVGGVTTPIWQKFLVASEALERQLSSQARELYGATLAAERRRVQTSARGLGSIGPHVVARAIVHALTATRPRARYIVGPRAWLGEALRLLPERLRERAIVRYITG
jgi:NAD(P)-dependent dehydrogenase (short-subunit alcohol dehydrogenase family)